MNNITEKLGLSKPPIAIAFLNEPPRGVAKWDGAAPAGCAFWRLAMDGNAFYTVPSDHYSCAVGSYTHGISLPADRGAVLEDTIGFMVGSGYIQMAEVPSIPVLPKAPGVIAYAPVGQAKFEPAVVLIAAKPYSAMIIYEAALRAGAGNALTHAMGRPGCAVLPLALQSGSAALSFGCKGNRTFTGLPDEELYIAIPGAKWPEVERTTESILQANAAMESYYRQKLDGNSSRLGQ
jgi:uncharacterized protein (DUF169 family)